MVSLRQDLPIKPLGHKDGCAAFPTVQHGKRLITKLAQFPRWNLGV